MASSLGAKGLRDLCAVGRGAWLKAKAPAVASPGRSKARTGKRNMAAERPAASEI